MQAMTTCSNCGARFFTENGQQPACAYCNARPTSEAPARAQTQPYQPEQTSRPTPQFQNPAGKGLATASMVLGIISILDPIPPYILGLILGIVGLVLANRAKSKGYARGMRTAGFVLSIIGIVFNFFAMIGTIFL